MCSYCYGAWRTDSSNTVRLLQDLRERFAFHIKLPHLPCFIRHLHQARRVNPANVVTQQMTHHRCDAALLRNGTPAAHRHRCMFIEVAGRTGKLLQQLALHPRVSRCVALNHAYRPKQIDHTLHRCKVFTQAQCNTLMSRH